MQVSVNYPSSMKHFVLTPSRRALGKALGRATQQSFAKHAVSDNPFLHHKASWQDY